MKIELVKGDITKQDTDVIVNAANKEMGPGSGVNGAIREAAGPDLRRAMEEAKMRNKGMETGEAVMTTGGDLKARYVIHTVGPVWDNGGKKEAELLEACYKNTLEQAEMANVQSIAFPNISTGVFGYPREKARDVVFETFKKAIPELDHIDRIVFVCHDKENYKLYEERIDELVELGKQQRHL